MVRQRVNNISDPWNSWQACPRQIGGDYRLGYSAANDLVVRTYSILPIQFAIRRAKSQRVRQRARKIREIAGKSIFI